MVCNGRFRFAQALTPGGGGGTQLVDIAWPRVVFVSMNAGDMSAVLWYVTE